MARVLHMALISLMVITPTQLSRKIVSLVIDKVMKHRVSANSFILLRVKVMVNQTDKFLSRCR
jgi:hypothetical protein